MDMQSLINKMSAEWAKERAQSQMTLGAFIDALKECPQDAKIRTSNGCSIGEPLSYRGYYEDLAFRPNGNLDVKGVLDAATSALGETFEGYKGGDYIMHRNTPLWLSGYGECSQLAFKAVSVASDGTVIVDVEEVE
jgi:hypothetical protein